MGVGQGHTGRSVQERTVRDTGGDVMWGDVMWRTGGEGVTSGRALLWEAGDFSAA